MRKLNQSITQDDARRMRRASLLKMAAIAVFIIVVLVFGSLAWFTSNKEAEGTGVQMTASGIPFTFQFPGTDEGKWIEQYRSLCEQSGIWLVAANEHMDNGTNVADEYLGLEPGDSGTLEFRLEPVGETQTIQVDLCFTMRCIVKPEKQNDNVESSSNQQLVEITDPELLNYVASHIMLFTGIDENGKYTGLLQNNADLQRYIRNKTYEKNGTDYTSIYWVWPLHLSNIISAQQSDLIYTASERETVLQYIVNHKTGFFKDIDADTSNSTLLADLTVVNHYGSYSIMFDKADLDIGNKVQYVILGVSAT